jgi:hypothetical protein
MAYLQSITMLKILVPPHIMPARRFPPPWTVEDLDGYFIVKEAE